jgi:hypothetical protein
LDDGDLVLSVFSLNKVASVYGLNLSGARLNWDDLRTIYDSRRAIIEEVPTTQIVPGSSISFDGNADSLLIPDHNDWDMGTQDFTIDLWANFKSLYESNQLIDIGGHSNGIAIHTSHAGSSTGPPTLEIYLKGDGSSWVNWTPSLNQWHHIAVVRQSGTLKLFINGILITSWTGKGYDIKNLTQGVKIGDSFATPVYSSMDGYLDGIRVSKGIARYTQNFTPQTLRYTPDSYTKLLVYSDPSGGLKDYSALSHTVQTSGNTAINASFFAQSIEKPTTKKVITRYPSTIQDPSSLTPSQIQHIIDHPEDYNPRVIAHINGNHYVIITNITENSITYIDPGIGEDKHNEILTVSKTGFLKAWRGDVSAHSVILSQAQQREGSQIRLLSVRESQSIRGAFWGSILSLAGWVLSFTPLMFLTPILQGISIVVSVIEGDFITAIGNLVTFGLGNLSQAFSSVFEGLSKALGPIGQFFQGLYQGVVGVLNAAINFLPGIGPALQGTAIAQGTSIGAQIVNTALSTGLNLAVSKGLESLGVTPQISGFIGSLTAGAVIAGLRGDTILKSGQIITQAQNIQSSVQQTVTLSQIGQLGLELGLDPSFTNIVGLSLGAIQGNIIQNPQTTFEMAFNNIKPQLFSSLAQWGVTRLGTELGVDSNLSMLIGAPILAGLDAAFQGGINAGQTIINNVQAGLLQGAISYGLSFTGTESPLIGSLLSRDITNSLALAIGRDGLFNTVFNILQRSVLNVFNVAGGITKTLFQGITHFGTTIEQKGLIGALESLVSSAFSRNAQEVIVQKGGIQGLFNSTPQTQTTLASGQQALELKIDNQNSLFFDDVSNLIGKKDQGIYQLGDFGYDSFGNFALLEGNVYADLQDGLNLQAGVRDGQLISIFIEGPNNESLIQINPEKDNQPIYIEGPKPDQSSASFNFWNAAFNLLPIGLSLFVNEGTAYAGEIGLSPNSVSPVKQLVDIALLNGFSLFRSDPEGTVPDYFQSGNPFRTKLNSIGISDAAIKAIALFEKSRTDYFEWAALKNLSLEIQKEFSTIKQNQPNKDFIPVGYSGAGRPLLDALNNPIHRGFGVETVVLVGAPINFSETRLYSMSLQKVINVYGTDDLFLGYQGQPAIAPFFINNGHSITTINIELKDINHVEYFYESDDNPTLEQIKASNFIARLAQASLTDEALARFLELVGTPRDEIYTDPSTGIKHKIQTYVVDTKNLSDNF